jgi:iron(III) transport system ATP-binding protein
VALARALAPNPRVVLLDEPFSALDAGLRAELREEVRELMQRIGTTAILVTHDQEEALSLADHVAIMRDGLVVQADSPQGVYIAPEDPHIAAFIGEVVLLPGRFVNNPDIPSPCAECALGCVAVRLAGGSSATSEQCMVLLRPEQLELADHGAAARVISTSFFGHDGIVRLRLGEDGSGSPVLVRIQGNQLPSTGDRVAVRIAGNRPAEVAAPAFTVAR